MVGARLRVGVRIEEAVVNAVEAYRIAEQVPSQSEAIRLLLIQALKDKGYLAE